MKAAPLLIVGILTAQFPSFTFADHEPGHSMYEMGHEPGEFIDKRVEHMTKKLGLNDSQKDQLKQVLQSEVDQIKPLQDQMKTIHDDTQTKIKAMLTPDQLKKYESMKDKRM